MSYDRLHPSCDQLKLAAAKLALDLMPAGSLPDVATAAPVDGCDSPSLVLLAGLAKAEVDEANALFKKSLEELNISVPSDRDAVLVLTRQIALGILDGTTNPYAGARRIWDLSLRVAPQQQLPELDTFIYAASEWESRPADRNIFVQGILAGAQELVGG